MVTKLEGATVKVQADGSTVVVDQSGNAIAGAICGCINYDYYKFYAIERWFYGRNDWRRKHGWWHNNTAYIGRWWFFTGGGTTPPTGGGGRWWRYDNTSAYSKFIYCIAKFNWFIMLALHLAGQAPNATGCTLSTGR